MRRAVCDVNALLDFCLKEQPKVSTKTLSCICLLRRDNELNFDYGLVGGKY